MRILVVEDDLDIAGNVGDFLAARGHQVDLAYDGISGMHLALTRELDAMVVDWMLPGMSGVDLCRRLRDEADRRVPILMLSVRDTLDDKLRGFEAGADDYLVKPFALLELECRLQALDRRSRAAPRVLRVGDLELDPETRVARRAGRLLEVQGAAFEILRLLLERYPKVVSREELESRVWGDEPPETDVLRTHVCTLRREIDRPFGSELLRTVRGVGYQIRLRED
jgi:DNA-binding response OmpR family regulator